MDLGAQFCERCGRDSDSFASAHISLHACPGCGVTCCSDCWNLVDAACLKCAPFRLAETPRRAGTAVAAGSAAGGARMADVHASLVATPAPASATATANRRAGPGRRAGRVGIAAAGAWVIVAAMAVATFGAFPGRPGAPADGSSAASPAVDAPTRDGSGRTVPSVTPAQGLSPERATPGALRGGSLASPAVPSLVPVAGGISSPRPVPLAGTAVGPPRGAGVLPSATRPPGPVWVPPPTENPTPTPAPTDTPATLPGGD